MRNQLMPQNIYVEVEGIRLNIDLEVVQLHESSVCLKLLTSQYVFSREELKDLLVMVYSAADIHGMATANGTLDKVLSPKDYFKKNFNIDL